MRTSIGVVFLLALSGSAGAEERFYPVVGPDGRIQVIKGGNTGPSQKADEVRGSPAGPPAQEPAPGHSPAVAPLPAPPAAAGVPDATPGVAPATYGSDSYTDVEDIEGGTGSSGAQDRFYVIRDGSGQQITRSPGDAPAAQDQSGSPTPMPEERYTALPSRLQVDTEVSDGERPAGVPACLPADALARADVAGVASPVTLVVDRNSELFMGPGRVVGLIRLGERGVRILVSRSYSAKDRRPAFLDPDLLLLDSKGCIKRRVTGVFDRRYAATPRRHPLLRGDLVVHADEEYVLVVAATRSPGVAASSPFTVSSRGQLSFSIKK